MENIYTEHWKRTSLFIYPSTMYVGMFIDRHQAIEKEIKEVVVNWTSDISEYSNEQEEKNKQNHGYIWHLMEDINLSELQSQFNSSLLNQARFHRSYKDLFEVILPFIIC